MKKDSNKTQIHTKKSKKVLSGPFCFLIWLFKVEIIILAIYFLTNTIYNSISDRTKFITRYNIEKNFCKNVSSENDNLDDIFIKLNKNDNLIDKEKEFIKNSLRYEIEENIKYIDLSNVEKRLENLETIYHKKYLYNENVNKYELQNKHIYSKKIAGNYNTIFNEINIYEQRDNDLPIDYQKQDFDFSKCNKRVYFHELNHLLTKNTFFSTLDTFSMNLVNGSKDTFMEPINEIFAIEYFSGDNEKVYNEDLIYAYVLAEILPEDVIRKYKFYDNQSILISALLEIDNNIDEVYNLFYHVDKACDGSATADDYKNIHDSYAYFYEKKYDKEISEDFEIQLYLYGSKVQTNDERELVRKKLNMNEQDEILNIVPKGYFSGKYKETNKSIYIEYLQNGNLKSNNL